MERLFSWLQLSHLAAIVCRSAQNSAPTVRCRLSRLLSARARDASSTRLRARVHERREDERRGEKRAKEEERGARELEVCVVVPTRHQHSNPDDKGERVAGVRGQPGPVAGVRPISGRTPPRETVQEVHDDDCLLPLPRDTPEDVELPAPQEEGRIRAIKGISLSGWTVVSSLFVGDDSAADSIPHRRDKEGTERRTLVRTRSPRRLETDS